MKQPIQFEADPSLLRGTLSRRSFFQRVTTLGAAVLAAPILLVGCGGNEPAPAANSETGSASATTCVTVDEGDPGIRKALAYVDESPVADKDCANCRFFKEAASGEVCGGCEIITGKIAATGYCNSWVARPA